MAWEIPARADELNMYDLLLLRTFFKASFWRVGLWLRQLWPESVSDSGPLFDLCELLGGSDHLDRRHKVGPRGRLHHHHHHPSYQIFVRAGRARSGVPCDWGDATVVPKQGKMPVVDVAKGKGSLENAVQVRLSTEAINCQDFCLSIGRKS